MTRNTHERQDAHFGQLPATLVAAATMPGFAPNTDIETILRQIAVHLGYLEDTAHHVGAFPADAVFFKTQVVGKLFRLNAVIDPFHYHFLADAVIALGLVSSFPADGILRKTQSHTWTLDAAMSVISSGSFNVNAFLAWYFRANAVLRVPRSGSYTLDAYFQLANTFVVNFNAVLYKSRSASFTMDAVIGSSAGMSFSAQLGQAVLGQTDLGTA